MHLAFYLQSVEEILCNITKRSCVDFFFPFKILLQNPIVVTVTPHIFKVNQSFKFIFGES